MKKAMLYFAGIASVMLILIYLAGMPTNRRMDFALLASTIGTTFVLALAAVWPASVRLVRVTQFIWLGMVGVALVAIAVFVSFSLWKLPLPLLSQQWYAVLILLGIIGAPANFLLAGAYNQTAAIPTVSTPETDDRYWGTEEETA